MNPESPVVPSREELIRGLLATRDRLIAQGVITVQAQPEVVAESTEVVQPVAEVTATPVAPEMPQAPQAATPDFLHHPDVQKGLEQLLSEWDIFKSSGLFGLGAGGLEHPTYKKLAPLPVMAVVSARWEGADPKIAQNIKEYMDGWKQEQGIDAEPEETFETYLRRVIANILNITSAS